MEITYASSSSRDLASLSSAPSSSAMASTAATPPSPRPPVKIIPLLHPNTASSSSSSSFSPSAFFSSWTNKLKRYTLLHWIETFFPCCRWIRTYKWREYFQVDLMAGITVGIMLVPQVLVRA